MTQTVIVGAGPIGLSWALMLHRKGVQNISIIDNHAGEYVRPGHVTPLVFERVNRYLKYPKAHRIVPSLSYHIKDFERGAYANVERLGINVIKKTFVRFIDNGIQKGVIIKGSDDVEECIDANYVFDATGEKRAVMRAIKAQSHSPYLNEESFVEHNIIPNHMIANVYLDKTNIIERDIKRNKIFEAPTFKSVEDELKIRLKLKALGWTRFIFPVFYIQFFNLANEEQRTKVCCYMETPPELTREKKGEWLNLLLSIYTEGRVTNFTHLSPSKKYPKKDALRVSQFSVKATKMEYLTGFKGCKTFPVVIPIGDAMISSYYLLGHGIMDGLKLLKILSTFITVKKHEISHIDSIGYSCMASKRVNEHITATRRILTGGRYGLEKKQLPTLKQKIHAAITARALSHEHVSALMRILESIEGYEAFLEAKILQREITRLQSTHRTFFQAQFTAPKIKAIKAQLAVANSKLPDEFIAERAQVQRLMQIYPVEISAPRLSLV